MSIIQDDFKITIHHNGNERLYIFIDDDIQKDKNNNISGINTQIEILDEDELKKRVRDGIMDWEDIQRRIDENKKNLGPHDEELIRRALANLKN